MSVRVTPLLLTIVLHGCASPPPQRAAVTASPAAYPSLFVLDFDAEKLTTGSGFFVSPGGLFVTCGHVVRASIACRRSSRNVCYEIWDIEGSLDRRPGGLRPECESS